MAVLTTKDLFDRIYAVLDAKFDTYAAAVATGIEPIRTFDTVPPGQARETPAVFCALMSWRDNDSPQETGSDLELDISVATIFEAPYVSREHADPVHLFRDAMVYTLKKERQLLHPTTGERLAWLHEIWPVSGNISWYPAGRGKRALIDIRVTAWIGEAESY